MSWSAEHEAAIAPLTGLATVADRSCRIVQVTSPNTAVKPEELTVRFDGRPAPVEVSKAIGGAGCQAAAGCGKDTAVFSPDQTVSPRTNSVNPPTWR